MTTSSDDLRAELARLRAVYHDLPTESAFTIIEECIGKLLLLPEAQAPLAAGIAAADNVVGLLIGATVPVPMVSTLGVKGVDVFLHFVVAWLQSKARAGAEKGSSA